MRPSDRDAVGWAAAIRDGEVTPRELVEAARAHADAVNPWLNAIVTPLWERALDAADDPACPGGPLAGVPCMVKDLTVTLAGVRHTAGSRLGRHVIAERDSNYARRLLDAGLLIAGVTNTPEFGGSYGSESVLFGPARNPWDLRRSAGGSSAGSAAAVAAGIVPLAHGNDAGGSLRAPASCCGLFAFKPSRGTNVREHPPDSVLGAWQAEHVLTRSVRDSATVLAATGLRPEGTIDLASALPALRIAITLDGPEGVTVDPDCATAVTEAAHRLEQLGHHVEPARPPCDDLEAGIAAGGLWADAVASVAQQLGRRAGRAPSPAELEPRSWLLVERAASRTAQQRAADRAALERQTLAMARFFDEFDVWLTPVLSDPPPLLDENESARADPAELIDRDVRLAMFLPLANVTGQPAMSLPLGLNPAGLPIGVHAMGRLGTDRTMLALAAQLEREVGWTGLPPLAARATDLVPVPSLPNRLEPA